MDSQILPLWTRYAVARLDAEEGALLRSPEISEMLASALAGPPPSGVCPFTLKHLLPKIFHPWMQPCLDASYRPQPGTPKAIRLALFHWLDSRRRRNLSLLRRAIQSALAQLPNHPRLRSPSGQTLGCWN